MPKDKNGREYIIINHSSTPDYIRYQTNGKTIQENYNEIKRKRQEKRKQERELEKELEKQIDEKLTSLLEQKLEELLKGF